MTIYLLFASSVIINGFLIWYIYKLLAKFRPISDDLHSLYERLDEYRFHTKTISEMESFYGEPMILNLLRHSKDVVGYVDNFRKTYELDYDVAEDGEEILEDLEEEPMEEDVDDQKEDDTIQKKKPFKRKAIFHQGT